jgi:hypothetical protein
MIQKFIAIVAEPDLESQTDADPNPDLGIGDTITAKFCVKSFSIDVFIENKAAFSE